MMALSKFAGAKCFEELRAKCCSGNSTKKSYHIASLLPAKGERGITT